MRGSDGRSGEPYSYVDLEQRVRADHRLRAMLLPWLEQEVASPDWKQQTAAAR